MTLFLKYKFTILLQRVPKKKLLYPADDFSLNVSLNSMPWGRYLWIRPPGCPADVRVDSFFSRISAPPSRAAFFGTRCIEISFQANRILRVWPTDNGRRRTEWGGKRVITEMFLQLKEQQLTHIIDRLRTTHEAGGTCSDIKQRLLDAQHLQE